MRPILRAALVAGTLSGIPSTVHSLATGRDPLESTRAAGTLLRPNTTNDHELLAAGAIAHAAITLGWTAVLATTLPRSHRIAWGALAGAAIAAVDMGLVARRYPRIHQLPALPQLTDHVAFGMLAAAVLAHDRTDTTRGAERPTFRSARRARAPRSPACRRRRRGRAPTP
jgi:hypothetical protein